MLFCEFSINNSVQASTAQTPFFLDYGLNPRCPADLLSKGATNSLSRNWIEERNDAIKIAQGSIVAAQARQALYYDRGRVPAELKVGQKVMVSREFMVTPDLSSGTTTNRSTQHKQTTLVTDSCTVNGIDQSYTELSEIPLETYQASVELDASRFMHEIAYAAYPICRLLPDAAIE